MEDELFDWISELRCRNLRVSYRMIREKAKALSHIDGFTASREVHQKERTHTKT